MRDARWLAIAAAVLVLAGCDKSGEGDELSSSAESEPDERPPPEDAGWEKIDGGGYMRSAEREPHGIEDVDIDQLVEQSGYDALVPPRPRVPAGGFDFLDRYSWTDSRADHLFCTATLVIAPDGDDGGTWQFMYDQVTDCALGCRFHPDYCEMDYVRSGESLGMPASQFMKYSCSVRYQRPTSRDRRLDDRLMSAFAGYMQRGRDSPIDCGMGQYDANSVSDLRLSDVTSNILEGREQEKVNRTFERMRNRAASTGESQ